MGIAEGRCCRCGEELLWLLVGVDDWTIVLALYFKLYE